MKEELIVPAGSRHRAVIPAAGAALALGVLLASTSALPAQAAGSAADAGRDSVVTTPRTRYEASGLIRLFLGDRHRELWSLPVPAEVLDLDRFAGGLEVTERGGGKQTSSLRFRGADGLEYSFRSIDKDASRGLDPELRETLADDFQQDMISGVLPLGALVTDSLLSAAGVLHPDPKVVVMPDDPRLGEFRSEFAGLLGFIEEHANEGEGDTPGFAGSSKIKGSEAFFDDLEDHPRNRLDERSYLRARLLDMLVGDWDRHPGQWRWASFEQGEVVRWEPVPEDRDWAFSRMDGLIPWGMRFVWPHFVGFETEFPSVFRMFWSARALDRPLLTGLSRQDYLEVAAEMQDRITDDVIEGAVRRLPDAYYERVGDWLVRGLKNRRDGLVQVAQAYYELLAAWVDIEGTDVADYALIRKLEGDRLTVRLSTLDREERAAPLPYYEREFLGSETEEIRIDMHGGDDRVVVEGEHPTSITIRVEGGGSDDTLIDATPLGTGAVHFYDESGDNEFVRGPETHVDESDWTEPDVSRDAHQAPPRDWGHQWIFLPELGYNSDIGLIGGLSANRYQYGFRHIPYEDRLTVAAALGTASGQFIGRIEYDTPLRREQIRALFSARFDGADQGRFFGFGNDTREREDEDFFEADHSVLDLAARLRVRPAPGLAVDAGPFFRRTEVDDRDGEPTLIGLRDPYGAGTFHEAGLRAGLLWDRRDTPGAPSGGFRLEAEARAVPAVLDVTEAFAGVRGQLSVYVTPPVPLRPTIALRGGGERVWGTFPVFEAAYLGGIEDLRGFRSDRFAGEASLYTSGEVRFKVADISLLLPMDLGLIGLYDAGRVFVGGEDSGTWHQAAGGGVWASVIDPAITGSFMVARGDDRTSVYFRAGFAY